MLKNMVKSFLSFFEEPHKESIGKKIYTGLKNEDDSLVGDKIKHLLKVSCEKTLLTQGISTDTIYYIHNETLKGRRPESITADIKNFLPTSSDEDLYSIIRTIASKSNACRVQAEAEKLGFKWYIWQTCQDQRVRQSHKFMQGVLVSWSHPPSPEFLIKEPPVGTYHAGEGSACRCYASPLFDINDIKWSHKVYIDGKIIRMTKSQLKKIM